MIAFGTEYMLLNTENVYLAQNQNGILWESIQSKTEGGTGIVTRILKEGGYSRRRAYIEYLRKRTAVEN